MRDKQMRGKQMREKQTRSKHMRFEQRQIDGSGIENYREKPSDLRVGIGQLWIK